MRTTKARLLGGTLSVILAGGLATVAVVASTNTVSYQDMAELTGAKTGKDNRWLTRLVSVPKGSDFAKAENRVDAVTTGTVNHAVAVKTAESLQTLDRNHVFETGVMPTINRGLKGDRVIQPKPKVFAATHPHALIASSPLVPAAPDPANAHRHHLISVAQSFRQTMPVTENIVPGTTQIAATQATTADDESTLAGAVKKRIKIAKGQMKQARAAAKLMAKAMDKAKKSEVVVVANQAVRGVASSYAPAVSKAESTMASAFAAILRPSVKKKRTSKIRLARGDHKWAANPLPRHSYSRNERRCLATGVYFEARGEPVSGQKAVAQVIINRVKNPAYPKTICGVVYQNKWRRNACQFSFACDGIRDRVNSKKHWNIASKVANDAIDGKFWLRSVGSSSHYHADYVWPRWRRKMRKMVKIGRHIFYRTYGGGWS